MPRGYQMWGWFQRIGVLLVSTLPMLCLLYRQRAGAPSRRLIGLDPWMLTVAVIRRRVVGMASGDSGDQMTVERGTAQLVIAEGLGSVRWCLVTPWLPLTWSAWRLNNLIEIRPQASREQRRPALNQRGLRARSPGGNTTVSASSDTRRNSSNGSDPPPSIGLPRPRFLDPSARRPPGGTFTSNMLVSSVVWAGTTVTLLEHRPSRKGVNKS